ncbi:hypothetical protein ABIF38_005302 [Bradyrhizobium japonicum]|jgi:hypothetical protein|nr:hypothetical protein [Bradyrhizobium elkanii]MCP1732386.1 hypothetical protein [Bradyrhizobium elkanii]MCP1968604.1 hypothetical protein [Bradyrhizobium elkanii]MCS3524694.1 hypothetical protein [Bradyrhizobium elkanii]MCS3567724.1 hypothetical protein [Bradyrhizobium elkanii]MCS3590793.1 hypothetical protein [Bradyrhizobium elkanii]
MDQVVDLLDAMAEAKAICFEGITEYNKTQSEVRRRPVLAG